VVLQGDSVIGPAVPSAACLPFIHCISHDSCHAHGHSAVCITVRRKVDRVHTARDWIESWAGLSARLQPLSSEMELNSSSTFFLGRIYFQESVTFCHIAV
jgi:hypothetical protein